MRLGEKDANANKILLGIEKIEDALNGAEFVCTKTDGKKYDFSRFLFPLKFIVKIHNYEVTLDKAVDDQPKLGILINKLNNYYKPRLPEKVIEKDNVLKSARKLLDTRKDIINFFKRGIFLYKGKKKEEESEEESEKESEEEKERVKKFIKHIENESKDINYDLLKKHFFIAVPSVLIKELYETKNRKKNNELVNVIKSRLSDLKDEIKEMSEDEKEIEKPDKILKIVEEILDFNNKQNQIGKGLKMLTPSQMLSRLPISLAQLKAGNNSEKLNKIR